MTTTVPAYTFGGITRPELILDDQGRIVLFGAAADFAATYGLKALYAGLPANTPYPPVTDSLSTPVDSNGGVNSVAEGAAANTSVGITASASSAIGTVTYSLVGDNSGGGFKIDAATGVVTVNDPTKIDFESAPGHAYTINVQASDGIASSTQAFTIGVTDVAPSAPTDTNAGANTVTEGAAAGTAVGITAHSTDVNGGAVTYSLTGDTSGGGFKVDANTGVVTVNDPTKIDFESSAPSHTYTITVQSSDGTLTNAQTFTIGVADVPLPTPTDTDAAANSVAEGATAGTHVGITASAIDPNGPTTHYSLTGDSSGGGFKIDGNTGVVTVADPTKLDFESTAPGHTYSITVKADDGLATTTQAFSIAVTDVAPPQPADSNLATNAVFEGAGNGTAVGVTAHSNDVNGGLVTYTLTDNAGGRFAIDSNSGVVTVANGAAIDYETAPGHAYSITAQASDGTLTSTTQTFSIGVLNVNEAPSGTDKTVTTAEGNNYTFTVADFGFSDPSDSSAPNSLLAVKITTVPGGGVLTNNGVTVNAGDFVSATDINAGHLVFAPTAHANGSPEATFTFQVQDNGGTANGGVDLDQSPNTMSINVTPVDDAPVNSVPGAQSVNEDSNLVFSTANANAITISDIDVGAGNETVTLTVGDGTLALGSTLNLASFTNNAASITLTGTVANVNTAMNGLTYHGNLNFNGPDSLSVVTNDNGNTGAGGPLTDTDSVAITVNAVNDAPLNGVPAGQTVLEDTNLVFSAANSNAITVSDVDANGGNETVTLTVTSGTLALGSTLNLASFTNNAASITLTGTIANVNSALDGLTYHGNANFNGSDSLSIVTNDNGNTGAGGAQTDTDSVAITVTPVNDAPAGTDTTIASVGAHTFAASEFGFTDPADAAGGSGANSLQAVEITTTPTTGTLTDNGVTVTAGQFVSAADINAGLLVFTPVGNNASSFTFQVQDNGGTANGGVDTDQSPNTFTILQDTPPVVTAGHTLNYTENQAATAIDPALTVTDSDSANLAHATVQITGNYVNGEDILGFTNTPNISGSFDAASGTLTLTGTDTVANYQTALESVTYFDNSDNPSSAPRTVTIIANDGTVDSTPVTDTINVTPVNDPPVVNAGHTLNYTENQAATAIDSSITVTDVDNANLASATVQITGNYANGQDILGFTNTANITGSFNAGTGTLTLTGTDTVANYQAALDSVTYFNNSDNPSVLARTVTIIANDGTTNSTPVTDTINVTPVDDAPVTTAGGTLNYTENQAATAIDTTVNVSDVDNTNLASATVQITGNYVNGQDFLGFTNTATITGSFDAATGTLTLTGSDTVAHYQTALDSVTYFNNSDNPSALDRTVSYTVNDGALNSNTSTSTIHVTPVNDPPVVTATGTLAYTEDQAATAIASALTVTDPDSTTLASASVQISANYVNGEDVLGFSNTANITGSFDATTGTMTLTGTDTVAHYQTALESVTYTDTSENPSTAARTVTFTADDGQSVNHLSAGSNHTINVTSVDDAPTVTVPGPQDPVSAHTDYSITGISTADVDAGVGPIKTSLATSHGNITVTLSGGATLVDATVNGSHSVHIQGTPTDVNATLSSIVYHGDAGFTGSDALTVQTNDLGHTGTGGPLSSSTATVDIGVIPKVWFIDNTASAVGADGSQAHPFNSIAAFNAVNDGGATHPQTGDYVYLATGTGIYSETDGIHLLNNQQLVGGGDGLSFTDPLNNLNTITVETAGTRPVIDVTGGAGNDAIHLASGNTIHGLNIAMDNSASVGIADNGGTVGTLNLSNMNVGVDPDGAGALHGNLGEAISIDHGGALNVSLGSLASSGAGLGLDLGSTTGVSGTFAVSGATNIADESTAGILIQNSSVNATFTGQTTVNNSAGHNGDGIHLNINTGTYSFNGGLQVDVTGSGAYGLRADNSGTLNILDPNTTNHINSANGTAILIDPMTVNATINSVTSGGGTTGISLTGMSGSLTIGTATINGQSGDGVSVASSNGSLTINGGSIGNTNDPGVIDVHVSGASSGNVTIASSLTKTTAGHVVDVSGHTGGTISFSGAISATGAVDDGISLSSNTGATMNFSGGMTLTTGANAAFSATGGGTVNVTGTNHLTTTTGTALDVANTTIGSSSLAFHDISSNGAANGIVLNTTGTSGGLTVAGGTIQNSTGDGVSLTSTQNVSLSNMTIQNGQGDGILGNTVNGIVLNGDTVSGNGNSTAGDGEGNIYLYELTGDATHATTFNNLTVTNSYVHNVFIKNTGGTLTNLNVTNSTFSNNGASTHAGDEFEIDLATGGIAGSGTATVHATHNTFSGNLSTPSTFTATGFAGSVDDGTLNVHLGDGTAGGANTFNTNDSGITLTATQAASLNFDVNDNTITNNRAVGVAINHFNTGTETGFFRNNTIGTQGVSASGAQIGDGLNVDDEGTAGTVTLSITNNTIQSVGNGSGSGFDGIDIQQLNAGQSSSGVMNLTLTGNTIRDILDDRGLFINEGNTAGGGVINALVSGNSFSNADAGGANTTARVGGAPGGTNALNVTQANAATLASDNGLTVSGAPGTTMRVDTNVSFNHAAPPTPPATPQLALHGQGPGTADDLTMNELAPVLAAAIQHWADAGASAAQIAQLEQAHLQIADLPNSGYLANTDANGITIDVNAAGWGWFIDPTPSDNSEFHATATPNDMLATSGAAAGHIDLLTVLEHELGHVLGLPDTTQGGVMNVDLDTSERRLPDATDVAKAHPATASVLAWTDHLSPGSGGGDNFNLSPSPTPANVTAAPSTNTTPAPSASNDGPATPSGTVALQGSPAAAGDSFHWANTDAHTHVDGGVTATTVAATTPVATVTDPGLTIAPADTFNWAPTQNNPPTQDTHTAVAQDTLVNSILPDTHSAVVNTAVSMAVVDTTVHDMPVAAILPDAHTLFGPTGFMIH